MKFVNLIRNSYERLSCRVVHEGKLTERFEVNTGVMQGCPLLPFLLVLLAIDWITRTVTNEKRNGIQWTLWSQLDDLDFANDRALLSPLPDAGKKNIQPGSCLSSSRSEAQLREDKDPEGQHRH